jgi:hypothetical protein
MVDGFDDCDLLDLRIVRSPAPSVDCLRQSTRCQLLLADDKAVYYHNIFSFSCGRSDFELFGKMSDAQYLIRAWWT